MHQRQIQVVTAVLLTTLLFSGIAMSAEAPGMDTKKDYVETIESRIGDLVFD